jgi:nucleotide-binding universal stress UspA family protein
VLPYTRLLIAAACTPADAGLLAYAAMLAGLQPAASLRIVHVLPPQMSVTAERAAQERIAADLPGPLAKVADEGRLTTAVWSGVRLDVLLQEAVTWRADLLVVGQPPDMTRRSLARRLAMKAPCSILMMPDDRPPQLERILAPVDFSPRSAEALAMATSFAAAARIDRCQVLHVRFDATIAGFDEYIDQADALEHEAFSIFAARIDWHGVGLEPILLESSDVTGSILRIAAEQRSDLIVMGTRGRSRAAAVVLGSETDHVLVASPVPLLAVKRFGASLRLIDALLDPRVRNRGGQKFS